MTRRSVMAAVLVALAVLVAMPGGANAQGFSQGIFGRLFGRPPSEPQPPPPPLPMRHPGGLLDLLFGPDFEELPPPDIVPGRPDLAPRPPGPPPVAAVPVIPKDPDARKILVLGDFVAGGLAWGLDQAFAQEPKLVVVDRSNNSSGLVRDDTYDWNAQLLNILNAEKPDIVVVALGANDRQDIRNGKDRIAAHSDAWQATYVQRIAGMTDTLKVFGRPFFWVGAPPMRLPIAMRDMLDLNGLYAPAVEAAGGHFVDVWNGFTDENGNYISSGPDVDGQLRALRAGDGINFTRAGRLKLAFYVEREIRGATGLGAGTVDLFASPNQATHIEVGPNGEKRLVGPVISLSDPLPGASATLAGGGEAAPVNEDTPQYRMIVKGVALPAVPGRADDFRWPPPKTSAAEPVAIPTPETAAN